MKKEKFKWKMGDTYSKELENNEELLFGDKFRNKIEKDEKSEHKAVQQFLSQHRKFVPTKKIDGGERKFHGHNYSEVAI